MDEVFDFDYLDKSYKNDILKSINLLTVIVSFLPTVCKGEKKTIVFDFDETIFHNARWWRIIRHIFCPVDQTAGDAIESKDLSLPIHKNIPQLLRTIVNKGYHLHIVSSRDEKFMDVTIKNLQHYNVPIPPESIFLYKETNKMGETETCVCRFKQQIKEKLVETGYSIVLNVGDQESDLCGNFASFKIPSFYTTPCQCSNREK